MNLVTIYSKLRAALFFLAAASLLVSCASDDEESLVVGCKTQFSNVKYADISSIIQTNCTKCHSAAAPAAGYDLSAYQGVKAIAGSKGNYGLLYKTINHEPGVLPMPVAAPKLSECDIAKIKTWIDEGANQ